jgi:UDP-glucose 4,6-dehydratase
MIIILGGSGYIGTAFRRAFEAAGQEYVSVSRQRCNYYDPAALDELLAQARAPFLINAAGFTGRPNVDACELAKTECLLANAVLPGIIRHACERRGVPWGHVSSGCVYTGARSDGAVCQAEPDLHRGFRESDPPNFCFRTNNCSFYSGSKALGEELLAGAEHCFIWRMRMPFNHQDGERNYLSKLMRYDRLLDTRNSLSHLDECVAACLQCFADGVPFGTYHVVNSGTLTTRETVEMIRKSGVCTKQFRFFDTEADFLRQAVKTPRSHCVLDNAKALAAGLRLSNVADAMEESLRNWQSAAR